jgi:hypothetical protein
VANSNNQPTKDYTKWCENLTELVYEYERQTKKLPSKTTVLELLKWVKEKAENG